MPFRYTEPSTGPFRSIRAASPPRPRGLLRSAALSALMLLNGCGLFGGDAPPPGQPGQVTGFLGGVVADEPRAALIGREILSGGGTAADAAVATGFALAVALPSRAGLGAGGACVAYDPSSDAPNGGAPEAVLFTPVDGGGGGDRPASVPMLARGLFALHARYGRLPFELLVKQAADLAGAGFRVSRALSRDLQVVAGPLMGDPNAAAIFAPGGKIASEGQVITETDLGATLGRLRTSGVGDFYTGGLAQQIQQLSTQAGGGITLTAMRDAVPRLTAPVTIPFGDDRASFVPPPADGGLAAAAALQVLAANPGAIQTALDRSLAVAARARTTGGDPEAILAAKLPPASGGPYPASTAFVTLDRDGRSVACALTMDNLFGTGRIVPGMGFLLAASPARVPIPLLAAGIAWNPDRQAFRAAVGGSGQASAALAAAYALATSVREGRALPTPPPEPGRANVIECSGYLPGSEDSCQLATDPRGSGLAAGTLQ